MVILTPSGSGTIAVNAAMLAVSTLGVALRLLVKTKVRQPLALDDGLIFFSLMVFAAYVAVTIHTTLKVEGTLEYADMTLPEITGLLKNVYVLEILMTVIITAVKLSIIFWYRTVFSTNVTHAVEIPTIVVGVVCIIWFLVALFVLIFQCHPIHYTWNFEEAQGPQCLRLEKLILGYEITNILIDVMILSIPISVVRSLHLSTQKKFAIGFVFLLGGFVCVACIVRTTYFYHPNNSTAVDPYHVSLWSTIELGVAILCACLPTLRPLVHRDTSIPLLTKLYRLYSKLSRNTTSASASTGKRRTNLQLASSDTESGRYLNLEQEDINLQRIC